MSDWWSWALTLIGVSGFWLAGRKVWWCWYINIANQGLWVVYALVSQQWGFLLGVPIYLAVFIPNAWRWTRDHGLAENGRRLASQREDLIAQGVDPADLEVPIYPLRDPEK